jgi:prepilin-type N-terminal cleavage/methylation domain-containing protein
VATRQSEHGYTMLELAIVLAVLGVLIVTVMHYRNPDADRTTTTASDFQEQIIASIFDFAERNFRLPCADTDGNGFEGSGSPGGCTATDTNYVVGGVPYKSLGLAIPSVLGNGYEKRFIYGVYRKTNVTVTDDADLAMLKERTGDVAGDGGYLRMNDFKKALRNAEATLPPAATDAARINVTGEGGSTTGAINCSSNHVMNVAFFVVNGGASDADANGSLFDGANNALSWPGGGSLCVAGPHAPGNSQYDDTVRAIGFSEILGYFSH